MTSLREIWEADKLDRQSEALMLEKFLVGEAATLRELGREQAFVLALDAQYGEGKSWFLARFRRQLALRHPVAFVDAWVDDANSEPLISIMAALEDALKPFLRKKAVKDQLGALTRAALPIIGKAIVGAGGKAVARYVGDEIGAFARDSVSGDPPRGEREDGPLDAGLEKLTDGVSDVVDSAGKALLDQYRKRQASRTVFKESLRSLATSIGVASEESPHGPIFVIIDELDRCRPSYAISLLEEIKHLFDVTGVVFVIALHGQQLTRSINAIYGERFDSRSYLRRFFTRHYALRRLSIKELVASHFSEIPAGKVSFGFPPVVVDGNAVDMKAPEVAGHLLSEWRATPREALSVVDGLRLFVTNWDIEGVPIELPLILVLLLNLVRGDEVVAHLDGVDSPEIQFSVRRARTSAGFAESPFEPSRSFFPAYGTAMATKLPQLVRNEYEFGVEAYMGQIMGAEFARRHNNSFVPNSPPSTSWSGYRQRVLQMAPFLVAERASEDQG